MFTSFHQCRDEISVDFIIILKFIFRSYVFLFNIIFKNFIFNKNGFCNAGIIQGLVLNLSIYLVIFVNGTCSSRILFMESKRFWNDAMLMLLFWSFKCEKPAYWEVVWNEFFTVEFSPIMFKYIGFSVWNIWKIWGAIRNCGKWSEMLYRDVTRNFSGKGSFVGISALR